MFSLEKRHQCHSMEGLLMPAQAHPGDVAVLCQFLVGRGEEARVLKVAWALWATVPLSGIGPRPNRSMLHRRRGNSTRATGDWRGSRGRRGGTQSVDGKTHLGQRGLRVAG